MEHIEGTSLSVYGLEVKRQRYFDDPPAGYVREAAAALQITLI